MINAVITYSLPDQAFQTNTVFMEPGSVPPRNNIASINGFFCRISCDPSVEKGHVALSEHQLGFMSGDKDLGEIVSINTTPSFTEIFKIISTELVTVDVSVKLGNRGAKSSCKSVYLYDIRENFLGTIFQPGQTHSFETTDGATCTLEILSVTTRKIECGDYTNQYFNEGGRFTDSTVVVFP